MLTQAVTVELVKLMSFVFVLFKKKKGGFWTWDEYLMSPSLESAQYTSNRLVERMMSYEDMAKMLEFYQL